MVNQLKVACQRKKKLIENDQQTNPHNVDVFLFLQDVLFDHVRYEYWIMLFILDAGFFNLSLGSLSFARQRDAEQILVSNQIKYPSK